MTYNPNICTPTMFEEELRALAASASFVDPQLDARLLAVGELRRAIKAVREIPGWSGESADTAKGPLDRMEKNASTIETTLDDLRTALTTSTASVAGKAAVALTELPSASADGFLNDAGRGLSGITDGWGVLDTGEAVAREEERLAAERETVAITKLKTIREDLTAEARQSFNADGSWNSGNAGEIPLPVIDVEGIDNGVPPIGSNGPGATGPGGGGGGGLPTPASPAPGSPTYPNPGGTHPNPGGTYPTLPGEYPGGTPDDPTVDSPGGGILPGTPGTPGGPGVWNPGGNGPGGHLPGGGPGGSGIGGVGAGVGGAAALLGGRAMTMGGLSGAAGIGGAGGIGGAAGGAPTSGRGLLGAAGAAGGSSTSTTGASTSTNGASAAGGRPGGMGMMGGGGGDSDKKGGRSTLGGPIAPELDIEDDERPRSRGAQAGSRNSPK